MDRYFFSKLVGLILLGLTFPTFANCPVADFFLKKDNLEKWVMAMKVCATSYNDDESQYKLAQLYEKDPKQYPVMLYFYQLAAESGHAEAQVRLSEILKELDKTPESREKLLHYQKNLVSTMGKDEKGFKGEFMHPYTLLLLASEPVENKWYYPSRTKAAPAKTLSMLRNYKISEKQKNKAVLAASKWKTRKLLEIAKEVVPDSKYNDLVKRLRNKTTQPAAMQELQNYTKEYVQNRHK